MGLGAGGEKEYLASMALRLTREVVYSGGQWQQQGSQNEQSGSESVSEAEKTDSNVTLTVLWSRLEDDMDPW